MAPTDKAVPFDELKERMQRRLQRMGIEGKIERVLEEEASWIPLGGTVPESWEKADRIAENDANGEVAMFFFPAV